MKAVIKNEQLHEKREKKIRRLRFLNNETYVNINNIPSKNNIPLWSGAFARISTLVYY